MAQKFLDYLEANAEEYWQVPQFEMAAEVLGADGRQEDELGGRSAKNRKTSSPPDDEDDLFRAAYEDVTYRDSTDDGVEGEVFEGGESPTDFELVGEAERIVSRLSFLTTVAQLWKLAATASGRRGGSQFVPPGAFGDLSRFPTRRDDVLAGWLDQATRNHEQLLGLLASVHRHRIPPPRGTQESLVEYDRRRSVKETLLEEIIQTCVETADAARMIRASMVHPPAGCRRGGVGAAGGRGARGGVARRRGRRARRLSRTAPRPGRAAAAVRRLGTGRQPADESSPRAAGST